MHDHIELLSTTGHEVFVIKKTGAFTKGTSTFLELMIFVELKTLNVERMICDTEYIYDNLIRYNIEHFYFQKHNDFVIINLDDNTLDNLNDIDLALDEPDWRNASITLLSKVMNKQVSIAATRTSDVLIIGRSDVFVEITFVSTKFETALRMVCNMDTFICSVKQLIDIILG